MEGKEQFITEEEQAKLQNGIEFMTRTLGDVYGHLSAQGLPEPLVFMLVLEFFKTHFTGKKPE